MPQRTPTARRLYSEDDLRAIRRVREQTERGLAAAQAIAWAQGDAEERLDEGGPAPAPAPQALIAGQLDAARRYDERAVEAGLAAALAHYPADRVLLDVLAPALVELGELWARGELSVAAEHFYSNIVRRRLLGLLAAQPALAPRLTAALACLPGEHHELGLLMLALFLRWAGARVLYLGADQPLEDLVEVARSQGVDAICLSTGAEADWDSLQRLVAAIGDCTLPHLYLGGAAAGTVAVPRRVRVLTQPLPEAARIIATGG